MKAPDFWYRKNGIKSLALAPLGQLYRAAGKLRRAAARPYRSAVPVICIGNVVAGGAGKTPTALAIAHLLQLQGAKPVFVSRGYGGAEKGPLQVDPERHNVRDVGDEALILSCAAPCWIGRNRVATIRAAEKNATHIIMDDGLQNPTIAPAFSLLVIDGATGLGNGQIIPAGPLRETLNDALRRIAAVVMIGEDRHNLSQHLTKPVFRAAIKPSLPEDFNDRRPCLAFAGIGRPDKFYHSCVEIGLKIAQTRDFSDHHLFTPAELGKLADDAMSGNLQLITTAKDWVRLPDNFRKQVAVLPVALEFEDVVGVNKALNVLK